MRIGLGIGICGMGRQSSSVVMGGIGDSYAAYTVYDAMLGDAGESIAARSPEKGGPWTIVSGDWKTDGAGYSDVNADGAGIAVTTGLADCFINFYGIAHTADNPAMSGIVFNFQDTNNYWIFVQFFNIYLLAKKVAGVDTNLIIGNPPPGWTQGNPYTLKVHREGDNISCFINGVLIPEGIQADADLKAATGVGVFGTKGGTDYWKCNLVTCASTDI